MPVKKLPNNAKIAFIIRDDDTCALTPVSYLETVYKVAWQHHFPVTFSVVPEIIGSKNLNIPPSLRGNGQTYPLAPNQEIVEFLRERLTEGLVEVAQHGLNHTTDIDLTYPVFGARVGYDSNLLTRSSEFYSLGSEEVKERLTMGRRLLERLFNQSVESFIAPQEYLTPSLYRALVELNYAGYSGGIRPRFYQQLPLGAIRPNKLLGLISGYARHENIAQLAARVSTLTHLPILPATYRHYWSRYQSAEQADQSVEQALALFAEAYQTGQGYFMLLTHYWEYFGDWQPHVTQKEQLSSLNTLLEKVDQHPDVWKCTVRQYANWLRNLS